MGVDYNVYFHVTGYETAHMRHRRTNCRSPLVNRHNTTKASLYMQNQAYIEIGCMPSHVLLREYLCSDKNSQVNPLPHREPKAIQSEVCLENKETPTLSHTDRRPSGQCRRETNIDADQTHAFVCLPVFNAICPLIPSSVQDPCHKNSCTFSYMQMPMLITLDKITEKTGKKNQGYM
jgi:hypothetical protein